MPVKGKKKSEWVAMTLCNFGNESRREIIFKHFSETAAVKAFNKINKIYGREGRCWQEMRDGRIINDNHYCG
jgi:hypothetical protein